MLHNIKELHGYKLGALDGEIGHIKGFYFDDRDWVIRYLVADTGAWMPGRRVLISPYALGPIYPGGKLLEVKLTREKIQNSPSIETDLPVARLQEADYHRYYGWPVYWGGPGIWGLGPMPVPPGEIEEPPAESPSPRPGAGDSRLRPASDVIGYSVRATDGEIGHVEDFLIDDTTWGIRYIVIATGTWWSGRNVIIPPKSLLRANWSDSTLFVNLTSYELRSDPEFQYAGAADHDPRLFR